MRAKTYATFSGIVFFITALVHVSRVFAGWSVSVAGYELPIWINVIAFVIAGYLAYQGLTIGGGRRS